MIKVEGMTVKCNYVIVPDFEFNISREESYVCVSSSNWSCEGNPWDGHGRIAGGGRGGDDRGWSRGSKFIW